MSMDRMYSTNEDEVGSNLFSACNTGNVQELKDLLRNEPYALSLVDMTKKVNDAAGKKIAEKTIIATIQKGHYDALKVLLKAGINPNIRTQDGTPLNAAVKKGSLDIVRLLIDYRAELSMRGTPNPLIATCIEGKLNILKYMVKVGADLYAVDNPPLVFTACTAGQLNILKYLMDELEYDIHRTANGSDALRTDGRDTLLYYACQRHKIEVASFLVKEGALITRTIATQFPKIVKDVLQQRFRPSGKPEPVQLYYARLKELGLAEIPWAVLADYTQTLVRIDLHSNYLTTIPDKIFQLPVLKILDVSHNRLPEICQEVVVWSCSQLSEFDASHNQLTYLPSGLFQMTELATLNLAYNLLSHLPGDPEDQSAKSESGYPSEVYWKCDKLKKMDVSHNRLRGLPECFSDLKRLSTLNASHNYLKELPQSCSHGCINLVHLDASNNKITDLPIGAANFWMHSLERLILSHNSITEISRNITELNHLTLLDLSHNRIKTLPPTSAWSGNRLNKLNLSFNQLTRLTQEPGKEAAALAPPKEEHKYASVSMIGGLLQKKLKKKGAPQPTPAAHQDTPPGDDIPRELPTDLWKPCLQSLYLQGNQIKFLPDSIGDLDGLARLDISGNSGITELPLTLGRLRNCWELTLNGVSIQNVPHHLMPGVARGGSTKHLLAYLRAQLRHCVPYNRMKLMVVGLQGRGKTTLLSVLRNPGSALPPNVSTVGVVVSDWTVSPPAAVVKGNKHKPPQRHNTDVVFSIWDMAGQEVYYATHQCFLSRNTLYLVVWNMEEGDKGIDYLRPWLLNIQARAPHSPILIVGTHLDKIPAQKVKEARDHFKHRIKDLYDKDGYPTISGIMMVSCVSQEGIKDLQERIHYAAVNAVDPDTKEHIIGMQVPSSYVALQKKISEEVAMYRAKEDPPVLNQKEFAALAESLDDNDIADPEELSLAAQFLHDNGILLHYNDHLRGLNNLYFIDPVWLADMLAEVVTVPEKNSFVSNGILKESNVAFIFRDNRRFPSKFFQQYLQLLERFEIALSLGGGYRLVPSMLPFQRPALNFATRDLVVKEPAQKGRENVARSEIPCGSTPSETEGGGSGRPDGPRVVDGLEVVKHPLTCIRRRYKMAYVPSGFWSRLISRLMINLKRSGMLENDAKKTTPNIVYWRRGIVVVHNNGKFLVEAIMDTSKQEMLGVGVGDMMLDMSGTHASGDGVDGHQGVDIRVWTDCGDFSAMGYVVDQLDSLIDEWFPGLNDIDYRGEWLVQRQVIWQVPQAIVDKFSQGASKPKAEKGQWDALMSDDDQEELYIFPLETCAAEALLGDTIVCVKYKLRVPLHYLVPDLLLTDLPSELTVDVSQFEFNPKDPATRLGQGGAGAVYKGKYKHELVAIKEFMTASQVDHHPEDTAKRVLDPDDDLISQGEALYLFRDLRQEVTVLAQLNHPNIVALLGVSIRPMCMVIEIATMGSLFGVLDKRLEQIKAAQAEAGRVILRMPGGILGHEISARIALQVALALRYLHKHGIVYRDLKSDNVLVWSLDVNEPVNIKLADYGISRFANPGGVKGEEGTPGYLAPEAIRRRGEDQAFDEKVDIFSYGMLLYELLTGQRPFENLTTTQELNKAVLSGDRPPLNEGNAEPAFPGMVDLMFDAWNQSSAERPTANEIVTRVCEPGFLCRQHTIVRSKDHPLQKIDTIYARPVLADDISTGRKSYTLWTWAKQDTHRNFSIIDVRKGVFNLPEKPAPGGRVYAMTATGEVEKRIWIGTADFEIQVYGYKSVGDPQCLWTFHMRDSVLALDTEVEGGRVKRVFSSLANGTLCVFARKSIQLEQESIGDAKLIPEACTIKCDEDQYRTEAEDWSNPSILLLGEGRKAAKCMVFVGRDYLWCGCGNTITVVDIIKMRVLKSIPVFVKKMALVNELVSNGDRVWGVGRQLSCVMEWDAKTFNLLHVFNCSDIDPTDEIIVCNPKLIDEIFDPEAKRESAATISEGVKQDPREETSFTVENDPKVKNTSHAPFSQRSTRRTLRGMPAPRKRLANIKEEVAQSGRARLSSTRDLVRRRQQGSTRITSLVIVGGTLWVARGMGDILVIDIQCGENHGRVLTRLATEDCEKFGNRSYHKLVGVAGEYVIGSQWLEPVDIPRGHVPSMNAHRARALTAGAPTPTESPSPKVKPKHHFDEPLMVAHQAITIWSAWNRERISQFMKRRSVQLMQEMDDVV